MFEELPLQTLHSVTGGFRIDPAVRQAMLNTFQQIASARAASLNAMNDSIMSLVAVLAAHRRHSGPPPAPPVGFAPIASGTPFVLTPAPSASDPLA
jgi:hypothetical protein